MKGGLAGKSFVYTPLVLLKKWTCKRAVLGKTKLTLLMAAKTLELFGPWQACLLEHWPKLSPTVTKNFLLTVFETSAGNFALAKLCIFWLY